MRIFHEPDFLSDTKTNTLTHMSSDNSFDSSLDNSSEKSSENSSNDASHFHQLFDLSAEQLVSKVADRTVAAILHAWREGREAQIVLTGGRTGLAIAKAIDVALFRATSQDSLFNDARVRIWFSDERFTSWDDADRSDSMLIAGFERSIRHIHFERVAQPLDLSLEEAAISYASALDTRVGEGSRFDAVILSMGEDGHIASLFPGHSEQLNSVNSAVAVDNSPKPPAVRVSIGVARLAKASAIYIFAVGESKRQALDELLRGGQTSPISMLRKSSPNASIFIVTDIKL
jgi:6-phosphogluconolactonase